MTDTPTLKPCPFCGGDEIDPRSGGSPECSDCGASARNCTWNARADIPPTVKPLVWDLSANGKWVAHLAGFTVIAEVRHDGVWRLGRVVNKCFATFEKMDADTHKDLTRRILEALA